MPCDAIFLFIFAVDEHFDLYDALEGLVRSSRLRIRKYHTPRTSWNASTPALKTGVLCLNRSLRDGAKVLPSGLPTYGWLV
jgi:hypothetical protein